jgi:hypothetical protein
MTWDFLHRWYMPFLWLAFATLVATPVAVYFQLGMETRTAEELGLAYGSSWVLRDDFLASIVVYLLGVGAVVWMFDANGSTRWAAFWATLAAIAHIAVPVALATMSDVQVGESRHVIDWQTLRFVIWFQDVQMFVFGIMLWGAFGRFVGETGGNAASSSTYAHA